MRIINYVLALFFLQAVNAFGNIVTPMTLPMHNRVFDKTCCLAIAHSGGGIAGKPYTNSKEALDANYALGRRVLEIDFNKTQDGVWALTHDWDMWAMQTNHKETRTYYEAIQAYFAEQPFIPTKAEFIKTKLFETLTTMALEDLVAWLKTHSDAVIITDIKNHLPTFFSALKAYPEVEKQIIFQAYSAEDLTFLKQHDIPLTRVIFTNYKARLSQDELTALFQQENVGALTLPFTSALAYAPSFSEKFPNIPIYAHGSAASINSLQLQFSLKDAGVSGFYLD